MNSPGLPTLLIYSVKLNTIRFSISKGINKESPWFRIKISNLKETIFQYLNAFFNKFNTGGS